jgi:hypothetical protein
MSLRFKAACTGLSFAFLPLLTLASEPSVASTKNKPVSCEASVAATLKEKLFNRSVFAGGMIVGSSNDIMITCLHCVAGVIPSALEPWLPLSNEIANVTSSAAGKRWIYSGISKQMADGVAMGSILGHSMTAGAQHGPLTGGLTLAANLGLTYWFPNKYLHQIMHLVPELVPQKFSRVQYITKSKVGQGMIGVSIIVVIEQALEKSEQIAVKAPKWIFGPGTPSLQPLPPIQEDQVRHATAAYLLDGRLGLSEKDVSHPDEIEAYLFGATPEGGLFSAPISATAPPLMRLPQLSQRALQAISNLDRNTLKSEYGSLLTDEEISAFYERMQRLKSF